MSAVTQVCLSRKVVVVSLVAVLVCGLFVGAGFWLLSGSPDSDGVQPADFYVGVTATGTVAQTEALIDKVKDYTNLIAFTNLEVTENLTSLEQVTDYAYKNGLSFFVQQVFPSPFAHYNYDPIAWESEAKIKYGNQFLGYYLYDEPGGSQLDQLPGAFIQFDNTSRPYDYRDAANTYVYYLYIQMRDFIKGNLVTSDYGLYWYDYEAGYDTVLCQFGWNNSRPIDIALCRGAAEMHNKTWGAIITWTYQQEPYLAPASEVYQDMVTAYNAGAKYVMIFNYPQIGPYGVVTDDHLAILEQFWNYVHVTPQPKTSNTARVAYLVPNNYGFSFSSSTGSIWGVWGPDNMTEQIWTNVNHMVEQYGDGFDILYDSPWTTFFARYHYDHLLAWDSDF
jgi:hypothetical protein